MSSRHRNCDQTIRSPSSQEVWAAWLVLQGAAHRCSRRDRHAGVLSKAPKGLPVPRGRALSPSSKRARERIGGRPCWA